MRVFCYQTGEVKIHDPLSVAMMQLRVSFATMERQGSVRTDAMVHKAKAGHAVGGCVFGYTTTELRAPDGRRLHVERRVHEAEATVVRRIFRLYAEGVGYPTIAHTLNHERALAPSPRRTGRLAGWAPSSVREILYRELYRGVVVWNRTKKRDPFGRKRHSQRDPADWIRLEAPTLRIVSHELWTAVQRRLEQARASYLRVNGGKVWGRPPGDVDTKYLLTRPHRLWTLRRHAPCAEPCAWVPALLLLRLLDGEPQGQDSLLELPAPTDGPRRRGGARRNRN